MRIVLVMAVVVVLFVDAFFFSGAYTQAAYGLLVAAGDLLVALIGGLVNNIKP